MRSLLRLGLIGTVVFVLLLLLFQQIAGFTTKQSFCLAIASLACLVAGAYKSPGESVREAVARDPIENWHKVAGDFSPHTIRVRPKWPEILLNYKLVAEKDEMEFRRLWEEGSFDTPISFTVLQGKWGSDSPGLIAIGNSFQSEVEFSVPVPKYGLDGYFKHCHATPKLYFRRPQPLNWPLGGDGLPVSRITCFEITLEVGARWWKQISNAGGIKIPPIDVRPDGAAVDVELVLAILPFSEVLGYYDPFGIRRYGGDRARVVESRLKSLPKETSELEKVVALTDSSGVWEKIRDGELQRNGWKRNDCCNDDGSNDACVEHSFFTVTHWAI